MSKDPQQPSLPLATEATRATPGGEFLTGVVERVIFHNEDNGFCVLRVKDTHRAGLQSVVGTTAVVTAGEHIEARGRFEVDPTHGHQFRANDLRISPPGTQEGIRRYLGSGMILGIGPELASRLVKAFGTEVFDVIERAPERLREVPGVGRVRARRIIGAWVDQKQVQDLMVFLHSLGIGTARALRIHRTYGRDAVSIIRADPFRLARDIRGVGFATADSLASRLGTEKTAPSRLRAGLRHLLGEARGHGHCALPEEELLARAEALLEVDRSLASAALDTEVNEGEVVRDEVAGRTCVFPSDLHDMERCAARRLLALANGPPPWASVDFLRALTSAEEHLDVALAPSQREAVRTALRSKVLVITGGPGVGKTTLLRVLLEVLATRDVRCALAAPTGRAAKRMSEATGRAASTLHRLLETNPRSGIFKRDEKNPLDCDLLVVDESSMLDVPLFSALLRAAPREAGLLLIGDVDQLPSVGPGQVLADIIASNAVPVVRLREVFRQAEQSGIVRIAHRINEGSLPEAERSAEGDFFFIESDDPGDATQKLLTVVRERIPSRFGLDRLRDIQVLSPMRRGQLGTGRLNVELQTALNPPSRAGALVERFGFTFAPGDKVMQIVNDYEKDVYNGDVGFVGAVDPLQRELVVEFAGRNATYPFDDLDGLALAYAITIHKSQGSEYPAVVILLASQHYPMLQRKLIYTAVTRARRLVVLIGERRALATAIRQTGGARRWSRLETWLRRDPAAVTAKLEIQR